MSSDRSSLRLFLTEAVKRPLQIGAIWPSSPSLGRAMAQFLPRNSSLPVLELGPGTGIVTAELLAAGLPSERLVAVEKSARLVSHLNSQFPGCRFIEGDALELDRLFGSQKFGAVISSLPLKVFTLRQVEILARQIDDLLTPGASWVQFSYHIGKGQPPSKSFRAVDSKIVWSNFPPAKVSVYLPNSINLSPAN